MSMNTTHSRLLIIASSGLLVLLAGALMWWSWDAPSTPRTSMTTQRTKAITQDTKRPAVRTPQKQRKRGSAAHKQSMLAHADELQKELKFAYYRVKNRPKQKTIRTTGTVHLKHDQQQKIGARAPGRVIRMYAHEGDRVRRGKRLLLIDSPEVGKARAQYLRALALWRLSKQEHARQKRLKRLGLTSGKKLALAAYQQQQARIERDSAAARLKVWGLRPPKHNAQLNGRYYLRALKNGVLTEINASIGQWVQPSETLLHIQNRSKVLVKLYLPLALAQQLQKGAALSLSGQGLSHTYSATLQHIGESVQKETQQLEGRLILDNTKGELRPGQRLHVALSQHNNHQAPSLQVPESAVQHVGLATYVFVKEAQQLVMRRVVTGASTEGWTEILHGLQAGQKVVAKGAFLIKSVLMQQQAPGN
ncbi:MAG TPA: hypothetical protein DCE42_01325 [Myxococcales bacterium]|nr:hypothetical protein [Myxococcales bacterium]